MKKAHHKQVPACPKTSVTIPERYILPVLPSGLRLQSLFHLACHFQLVTDYSVSSLGVEQLPGLGVLRSAALRQPTHIESSQLLHRCCWLHCCCCCCYYCCFQDMHCCYSCCCYLDSHLLFPLKNQISCCREYQESCWSQLDQSSGGQESPVHQAPC